MGLKIVKTHRVKVRKGNIWKIKKLSNGGFIFSGTKELYMAPKAPRNEKQGILKAIPLKVRERFYKLYPQIAQKILRGY